MIERESIRIYAFGDSLNLDSWYRSHRLVLPTLDLMRASAFQMCRKLLPLCFSLKGITHEIELERAQEQELRISIR